MLLSVKKKNLHFVSFSLKQAQILFSLWIKIIFLTPLADIFACFKQNIFFLVNKT